MLPKTLLTLLLPLLPALSSATPAPEPFLTPDLLKRGGESVHLCNCVDSSSQMYYYSNDGNYPPQDRTTVSNGAVIQWEGRSWSGRFGSGVTFTSNIQANARNYANYAYAGSGSNGYKNFNCYKDDRHGIGGTACNSYYYCLPA